LVEAIAGWRERGISVALACDSQSRLDRLHGVLAARGVDIGLAERPFAAPGVHVIASAPTHSFAAPADGIALVAADAVVGLRTHHATTRKRRARDALLGAV